jgi:hypothetical protein
MERVGPFFGSLRFMAHERLAPQAYVEDLDPNVHVTGREVVTRTREVPLTPARVREIEADWRRRTLEQQGR